MAILELLDNIILETKKILENVLLEKEKKKTLDDMISESDKNFG